MGVTLALTKVGDEMDAPAMSNRVGLLACLLNGYAKGHTSLTPSLLSFLSTLECGVNFGSEIARKLGVTRQMVAKTVKELCPLGYLEQVQGTGRQKEILFTERGEQLMSDARALLSEL